ncbi:energy-coupling factor ABC transporter permease [Alkalilimnicola ehrlichii MLHE-1]|uniref:Putative integral membrane protein n=1 Tax=Alkalilimnicola ehrlichii (strain ATCC BAA-1101 / DSM 17681 / MLHE-1) TaxID=187272 RepID=Q0A967_ALKEH|nr:energy-coupling factor ABC transporter permease [Alkalilimnicola ehrlichii]ABI56620.1 putative integral membrane protein [Alkalilimnicola ehrlichii MLHE-1]
MNIPEGLLPAWVAWATLPLYLSLLLWAVLRSPWKLLQANRLQHVFFGASVIMALLWRMQAGIHPGLELHLLGITAMTLIFGWRLALVGASIALLVHTTMGFYDWATLGINGLIGVVLPVLLASRLHRLVATWLPRHFFVYVLVSAHFAAMIVIAATMTAGGLLLGLFGVYPWERIVGDYLILMPLVMLPEGFVNGTTMTMLTVFKPEWVRSFDDRDYIRGK